MDTRWRNVIVILIVVCALVGGYYYLQNKQSGQPEQTVTVASFKSAWANEGYSGNYLHSDFNQLVGLSTTQLSKIQSNLSSLSTTGMNASDKALVALSQKEIALALEYKSTMAQYTSLATSTDSFCTLLPNYTALASQMTDVSTKITGLANDVNAFATTYPKEAASANLNTLGGEQMRVAVVSQDLNTTISSASGVCQ